MYFKLYQTLFLINLWCLQLINADQILGLFINGHRSHLLIYLSVVNLLTNRGHNVTIVTTLTVEDMGLRKENIRWLKLSENYTKTTISPKQSGLDKIENMLERIENTSKFMDDLLWQKFINESHQFDLIIIGYLFNDYQLGLAAHFNCPVVVIWTGQPIGFINSLMGNPEERWYVPQPYDRHQYTGLQGIAFGWFENFIQILALDKMKEIYDKYFPNSKYPTFGEIRKSVSLALCYHHSISEGPITPYLPGIIEIGGLEWKNYEKSNEEFNLRKKNLLKSKIIYISFGSRVKWSYLPTALELKFVQAFQLFPEYTILWTYDKNCTQLESLSSNIRCQSWWPQSLILALNETKLFITHGGKGSISEALRFGKPILGIPIFGDQRANVAKMESRKFGLKLFLENITVDDLEKTLRELLQNDHYKSNVEIFSKLYCDRPLSSENIVIYWLEYVIRYKGAKHLRSPALDLNIIEYYSIDIYIFIFSSFSVIILFLNSLEKELKKQI